MKVRRHKRIRAKFMLRTVIIEDLDNYNKEISMFDLAAFANIVGKDNIRENEPIAKHTTFRIGGPARVFAFPETADSMIKACQYLRSEGENYFILGNGSNLLVSDEGFDGVILSTKSGGVSEEKKRQEDVSLSDYMIVSPQEREKIDAFLSQGYLSEEDISVNDAAKEKAVTFIYAGAGALLSKISAAAAQESLTGFEFASGIPGSIGGAVTMNAGAYGGQIKDVVLGVRVLCADGEVKVLKRDEMALGYRQSVIQQDNMIVLDALFGFVKGDEAQIKDTIKDLNSRRREKQPLEHGSAGSTFKRPEGYFAGKLIEDAGLKGYRIGDIMVSEKHAGFVVNVGDGTFRQAMEVISHVKEEVYRQFGVQLETEVKML